MSQQPSQFSRREWLMVTAILLLIEYWITTWSYQHSSDQAVLNYISFAATISSILLAVIAIIYGFVQSDSQQRGSANLLAQIDNLRSLSDRLSESPIQLKAQLDRIDRIASKLDAVDTHVVASNEKLGSVHATVESIAMGLKNLATKPMTTEAKPSGTPNEIAKAILNRTTYDADIFAYALEHYKNVSNSDSFTLDEFLTTYIFRPYITVADEHDTTSLVGGLYQVISSLTALGLLVRAEETYTLSKELKAVLPDLAKSSKETSQAWVCKVIANIDQIKKPA